MVGVALKPQWLAGRVTCGGDGGQLGKQKAVARICTDRVAIGQMKLVNQEPMEENHETRQRSWEAAASCLHSTPLYQA